MQRSRSWIFTINNPTQEPTLESSGAAYITYGREVGANGTPHLQGFVQFTNAKTRNAVRTKLAGAHLEIRRGTITQAIEYCHKDGDTYEEGIRPLDPVEKGNAEKVRWEHAREMAKTGIYY